jgi:UDP-GlcNAc:undecaprenyl-phosphate GlcNAc-1-phosphate transferase
MVLQGVQVFWLPLPGQETYVLTPAEGTGLTVLVVVVLINAVNFVDGLDGLAAGIMMIAATAFFVASYQLWVDAGVPRAGTSTLTTALLAGVCAGFLPHNFHPARVFMGDTGSMLLGMLLAATSVSIMGGIDPYQLGAGVSQTSSVHKLVPAYLPLIMPVSVVLLPIADMVMAVVRRTKAGMSPLAADKGHLHHRMLQIGHSKRRAVLIMYFWSALVAFVTVLFAVTPSRQPIVYGAIGMTLVGLLLLLGPRLGDHRERLRTKALRGSAAPATARHRAKPAGDSGAPVGTSMSGTVGGTVVDGTVAQPSAVETSIPAIATSAENPNPQRTLSR